MALEAELRSRIEITMKELEEVVGSLSYVKQLAESQQTSAEQLSRVAAAMENVGTQFHVLLETVGESGAMVKAAAETLKAADPAPTFESIGALVMESRGDTGAARQAIELLGTRIEAIGKLEETSSGELLRLHAAAGEIISEIKAGVRVQAASLERFERAITVKIEGTESRVESLEKRVASAVSAAWMAAGMSLFSAVVIAAGLLR